MTETLLPRTEAGLGCLILSPSGYDNNIRWREGDRLFHLFERRCDELELCGLHDHPALEVSGNAVSYRDLLWRVSLMAEVLTSKGVQPGDRIGLLLDRSIEAYVVMLAVVKIEATYVPLDVKFPADRIAFIAGDAEIKAFVTISSASQLVDDLDLPIFTLEELAQATALAQLQDRPTRPEASSVPAQDQPPPSSDRLAYIIYTSGSTGRPKGVAVNHSSICNFVAVAGEVYGYVQTDRVYQGLTFAFDFSVEELWVPLIAGATLVPSPANIQLVGEGLADFLIEHRVTALCCVPTLLATIDVEIPSLRFLLVSGEACPQDLVSRWHRTGRRMLNAYGPTETTVTATWTELHPDSKVTIGIPLPTYSVAILDGEHPRLVPPGEIGEIAVGGIGLANGYLNRNDLTAAKFVSDIANLPNNPSRRLYRTGDLGRINSDGEIDYLGRIDTQVKLKGYRIELAEIEEVLLEIDGIAQSVVTLIEQSPSRTELVAYYTVFDTDAPPAREQLLDALRKRLPAYMVPTFLEPLDEIPLLPSHKADRKALPAPRLARVQSITGDYVAPTTATQSLIAKTLSEVLTVERVSIDDNFFEHLGLDSLRASEFVSLLNPALAAGSASIADVYLAPSVQKLANTIEEKASVEHVCAPREPAYVASRFSHTLCGGLQALSYIALVGLYLGLAVFGFRWISQSTDIPIIAGRSAIFSAAMLVLFIALPVAVKWTLIGRWRAQKIPLWSLAYFRFWLARLIVETSPLAAVRGSPLFNVYLRLLGAKIGSNVLILSKSFPLCTDLISIGENAVLRKNCFLTGYRAESGYLLIGPIEIGKNATVGEGTYIDLNTRLGDQSQIGHASALLDGMTVPANQQVHGSPARRTATDFSHKPTHAPSNYRRIIYGIAQVLAGLFTSSFTIAISIYLATASLRQAPDAASNGLYISSSAFTAYGVGLLVAGSGVLFVLAYLAALTTNLYQSQKSLTHMSPIPHTD